MGQATDKKSFLLYYSMADVIELLDDHQIANLFRAILSTGGVMEMPELDALTNMAFVPIKRELEENYEKWLETKKSKAEAGRKGGLKKAENLAKASTAKDDVANLADASTATNCLASSSTPSSARTNVADLANVAVDVDVDVDGGVDVDVDVVDTIGHSADAEPRPSAPYGQVQNLYNSICKSLPACKSLSSARKKAIKARFNSGRTLADFEEVFRKTEASSFLTGGNDRNWQANFDWLIKDANMAKVLDGNYDERPERKPKGKGYRYTSAEGPRDFSDLEE